MRFSLWQSLAGSLVMVIGAEAPASSPLYTQVQFVDGSGHTHTLKSWSKKWGRKPILVIAWAPWCWPCLRELPSVEKLQKQVGNSLHVLPIAIEPPGSGAAHHLPGISMKLYHSSNLSQLMAAEGMTAIPAAFLFDHEGRLCLKESGARDWDSPTSIQKIKNALNP